MKKVLAFFTLLWGFFPQLSQAQNTMGFAPPNAEWWHMYDAWRGLSLVHASVEKDTVIDGMACRKIRQEVYNLSYEYRSIDTVPLWHLYIYDTEDTIFIYNDNFNRFTPLYVFNVAVGDTVCLPVVPDLGGQSDLRPNPYANGDTSFCFIIDSIRTVLYDTVYLETFFQHSIIDDRSSYPEGYFFPVYNWYPNAAGPYTPDGAYTRLTGGLYGGLLPIHNQPVVQRGTDGDTLSGAGSGLRCYKDDSLSITIPHSQFDGCYFKAFTNIENVQTPKRHLRLFPNPSRGMVTLESDRPFPTETRLFITDLSGRIVQHLESPAGKTVWSYTLNGLSPGIYFLVITAGEERYFKKIVLSGE